ncbi:MAG TPA: hypothetical protein VM365_10885, partial [Gemmatimonadales bacterium]|nr:hypothetical protein [Gemmatimonadales bacterium]
MRDPLAAFGRLAIGGVVLATACSRERPADSPGATLEARWVGSDSGKIVAPAVAEWCDSLRLLEVSAVHGDTGIALVLYPAGPRDTDPGSMSPPDTARGRCRCPRAPPSPPAAAGCRTIPRRP